MNEVPSILSSNDALRKRLTHESAMREAATAARARVFWQTKYQQQQLPITAANLKSLNGTPLAPPAASRAITTTTTTTNAVYSPVALDEGWNQLSLFGYRRDRVLFGAHAICALVHFVFFLITLIVSASATDPYLDTWRQRFVFTRNTSECGLYSNYTDSGESPVTAVLIPEGQLHTGWATAGWFGLSCAAHTCWVVACLYNPLGNKLLVWLATDAWYATLHPTLLMVAMPRC